MTRVRKPRKRHTRRYKRNTDRSKTEQKTEYPKYRVFLLKSPKDIIRDYDVGEKSPIARPVKPVRKFRVVAFDLDETLGCFQQFGHIWNGLCAYYYKSDENLGWEYLHELLDLFPDFYRTNIIVILKKLWIEKMRGNVDWVIIYTNNQCEPFWTNSICAHIERLLATSFTDTLSPKSRAAISKTRLFDDKLLAWKIGGYILDARRRSHDKMVEDLLNSLPKSVDRDEVEIKFIDDRDHHHMRDEQVHYIQLNPYECEFSRDEIIRRLTNSRLIKHLTSNKNLKQRQTPLLEFMRGYMATYDSELDHTNIMTGGARNSADPVYLKNVRESTYLYKSLFDPASRNLQNTRSD